MPVTTLVQCCECGGRGRLIRLRPAHALSLPREMRWLAESCWRCFGQGFYRPGHGYFGTVEHAQNNPHLYADRTHR